jgi:hypothetical protein
MVDPSLTETEMQPQTEMQPSFRSLLVTLPDDTPVKLPPVIKESGRSRSAVYSAVKRGEIATLPPIGRTLRTTAREARRLLGIEAA